MWGFMRTGSNDKKQALEFQGLVNINGGEGENLIFVKNRLQVLEFTIQT